MITGSKRVIVQLLRLCHRRSRLMLFREEDEKEMEIEMIILRKIVVKSNKTKMSSDLA